MKSLRMIAIGCLIPLSATPTLRAGSITQIVAFGDSLTDTGNVYNLSGNTLPDPQTYYDGRFSNGPLWIDDLAAGLGVPDPLPSRLGGTNYAYGGAETALSGVSTRGTPNIGTQVTTYLATNPTITSGQLFVVWGGANDFLHYPQLPLPDPATVVANLSTEITELANAGARNFLVPNLPPLGDTPQVLQLDATQPGIAAQINSLTAQFNAQLAAAEANLQSSLNIKIFSLDTNFLLQQVIANPSSFGLTDVTDQAKSGGEGLPGVVVPNPDQYLFFDQVHPTAPIHKLLGEGALALVLPEPTSILLLCTGLLGPLALAGRRRRISKPA